MIETTTEREREEDLRTDTKHNKLKPIRLRRTHKWFFFKHFLRRFYALNDLQIAVRIFILFFIIKILLNEIKTSEHVCEEVFF